MVVVAPPVLFTVNYIERCLNALLDTNAPAAPSDMTVSALKAYAGDASDLQTLIFYDDVSLLYGNNDGTTYCGAR